MRKTIRDAINKPPWGTHICLFYQNKEDLIDILVPYFKAGLEKNEFCMWVTSKPLNVEEAKSSLKKEIKNLDHYLKKDQIEIVEASHWYTKSAKFEGHKVLEEWAKKERKALKKGYDGLRLSGDTFWLGEKDRRNFARYEAVVNDVIGKHRMITICSYSVDKCDASDIIDVVSSHKFSLIKQKRKWKLIESSERRAAEEALRESEERLKTIMENVNDVIFQLSPLGTIKYVSPKVKELYGYKPEELIGKHLKKTTPMSEIPKALETLKSVLSGKVIKNYEINQLDSKGKIVHMEINATPVKKRGKIIAAQGIMRDITERKQVEEELKESEERYRELVEKADIAILVDDKEGNIKYANKKAAEVYGYSLEEMNEQSIQSLVHPDDVKMVTKFHKGRLDGKKVPSNYVFRGVKKDGSIIYLEIYVAPDKKGESIIGTRIYLKDITERKKVEEELMESEKKYRTLYETIRDGIAGGPMDGRILECNQAYADMLGYSKDELKNLTYQQITPKRWHKMEADIVEEQILKRGYSDEYEKEYIRKDGTIFPISATVWLIKDEKRKPVGMWGIVRDITERKQVEEQIKVSLKDKELLLQEIHHRVKNNMQLISSLLSLQSKHIKDKQAFHILKGSQERVKSMALIHERLYQSKDLARIDFAEYVKSLIKHLFSSYGIYQNIIKYHIKIKSLFLDINTAIPCGLIINELVSNSLKHAFPDGKKGEIKIAMHPLNKNEIELVVSDNGVGLPKKVDFRNTESLGLHLVTILAEDQLSGEIKLDRTKGTSFQMRLRMNQ